ncbi:uncharacterized protein LOC6547412 [Drosophila erecta]|uniref:Ionotropic glutamate receptor C-terminal domain-containing protein n=1 Tax=Drosophila erecta TaxID=7220 RepID=B3NJN2_DROER|nr:uncharacterized protein LOC6547412 [Drosophila erecta]EDV55228.1 uncharacterized protein Dere_GG21985 [Drosophila erecta]
MQYMLNVLSPFAQMNVFQELVWFVSPHQRLDQVDEFIMRIDEAFGKSATQTVVNTNTEMRMSHSSARRNHISLVFTTGAEDPIMKVFSTVLLGRHFYFSMVIYVDKVGDMQPIHELLAFAYNQQFINSLVYFQSEEGINQLFGVSKFPVMTFENRTDILRYFGVMWKRVQDARSDVEGFRFATPLRQDLPHLFQSQGHYEGSTYRIIETFVRFINGSITELVMPPDGLGGQVINMKDALQLIRERKVEFCAHAYALFMPDEELDKTYPLLVVQWCLMVPLYNSVSTYFYPLQPFAWDVWLFALGALLALVLLELMWLRMFGGWSGYHGAVLNSFCYIINVPIEGQLQQPCLLRFLLLATVFFHGFFLSAYYTSNLGSILTVNLFHAQINTMNDIVSAQLPVMIIDYEMDFLLHLNKELPPEFLELLRPVDSAIFSQHQTSFNSSFAYFVTDDHWQFLDEQQKHLKQRLFKLSGICFGSYHLAFPLQMDSSLWRDLEYFTFRIHSSGLLNFYARSSFGSALHAGLVQRMPENQEYTSAGLQHLAIAFILLLVMSFLAGIVFVLEKLSS